MSKNWLYLGIIPIAAAMISAGYFKEDVVTLLTRDPNYTGLTFQLDDATKAYKIFEEDWRLAGIGTSLYAVVKPQYKPSKSWEYRGFERGQLLSMSYQVRDERGLGIGGVVLQRNGASDEYYGFVTGYDCTVGKVIQCPYVLVPRQIASSARQKYSDVLSKFCTTIFNTDTVCK